MMAIRRAFSALIAAPLMFVGLLVAVKVAFLIAGLDASVWQVAPHLFGISVLAGILMFLVIYIWLPLADQ